MKKSWNRKIVLIAICLILSVPAFSGPWGFPSYLYIMSGSIENYTDPKTKDLPRSHSHKGRFVNGIMGNVKSKYSSIGTQNIDYKDASATVSSLSNSDYYEMVFFAGHGNTSGPLYDDQTLTNSMKKFGGWTRWVFWDACLTMNSTFEYMLPRFNGLHAFFGYKSLGYQFHKWINWVVTTSDHEYSEELWSRFANRWVKDGWGMWDAFQDGVQVEIANEGYSVEIGAFYMKGTINGGYLDGSQEKISNVYNNPIQWGEATDGCWVRQTKWGNPSY